MDQTEGLWSCLSQLCDLEPFVTDLLLNEWVLIGITILSCYMLNAEIPLFALKFKNWSFGENKMRYLFLLTCVLLIVFLKFLAIPIIIIFYVLLSLVSNRSAAVN